MNMKKTMAAIAAGTVAVSAMATTVSAEDTNLWPTRTLTFNLVQDVETRTGSKTVMTIALDKIALGSAGGTFDINIEDLGLGDLGKKDVVTVTGWYNNEQQPVRQMAFTLDNENPLYTPAGAAALTKAGTDGAMGTISIPVESNVGDNSYALKENELVDLRISIEKNISINNLVVNEAKDMRDALAADTFTITVETNSKTWHADSLTTGAHATHAIMPVSVDSFEKLVNKTTNTYDTNEATDLSITGAGNALNHVYVRADMQEVGFVKSSRKISREIVCSAINDGLVNFGNATFRFKTYTGDDATKNGFNKNWWDVQKTDDIGNLFNDTTYWINNWEDMTLFGSALVVNSQITMSLSGTSAMKWTKDALEFDWDEIQASALNPNYYTNYINNMVLRTGKAWKWEALEVTFLENTAEDVSMGAGDDANDGEIPDDDETDIDLGDDEGDDEGDDWDDEGDDEGDDWDDEGDEGEGGEDEGDVDNDQDVNSPKTGNPAVALAVIPVALAAAAVVAKKRG